MWKYEVSNTDHSLMQGVELVNRLLLGEPETTIGMKYACTNDGRNAAVHERSVHAGSGDPRKATAATAAAAGTHRDSGDKAESHISEEELGVSSRPEQSPKWRSK
jgi:hypothetical protein